MNFNETYPFNMDMFHNIPYSEYNHYQNQWRYLYLFSTLTFKEAKVTYRLGEKMIKFIHTSHHQNSLNDIY